MGRFPVTFVVPAALAALLSLPAFGDEPPPAAPPAPAPAPEAPAPAEKAADTKESLGTLVGAWQKAHAAKDEATLLKLAFPMIPTTADLKALLVAGAGADDFLAKFPAKDLKADDPMVKSLAGGLFKPTSAEQTRVAVHAATTEEIVAYAKDSVASAEFPGGMKRFAALCKPKLTFYVVELLEPDKDAGMKFSCFANVDGRWIFIAKPWRALGREEAPPPAPGMGDK